MTHSMLDAMHDGRTYQRVELITGQKRRRGWTPAGKIRIVAESEEANANVSEVARRNGVSRGLLTVWRRQAGVSRKRRLAGRADPLFVEMHVAKNADIPAAAGVGQEKLSMASCAIEIAFDDAQVRVPPGVDCLTLEAVISALRRTR